MQPVRQTSFDLHPAGEEPMQEYVVGFMITATKEEVVMILKNKPVWQAGFLNGPGGKVEPGETPLQAMVREFKEEAGVDWQLWHRYFVIHARNWRIHVYHAFTEQARFAETCEDEAVYLCRVAELHELKVIPNCRWLIPMAVDGGYVCPVNGVDRELAPVGMEDGSIYRPNSNQDHEGVA